MSAKTHTTSTRHALWRNAGIGLLAAALSVSAAAQETTPPAASTEQPANPTPAANPAPTEQVVKMEAYRVTSSFSGSLAAAAEIKEAMPVITEVIASEDIGKLPDISIADSLTRLTGLTTQRTNGRSQDVEIRGLTGDYSTGMLNGREQVSTGLNRSVEYDQYPTELINQVVVYKTAEASLVGQGLAGTIDLRTVQPLSKQGRVVAVSGYYQWTQLGQLTPGAKKDGNRISVSYIDQNAAGTLGIAIGFAHTSTPWEGKQFQAWGYPTDAAGNFALGGTKSYVRTSNLTRDGLMGVIEYKPNSWVHSSVDLFSSRFEEKQLLRGLEIPLAFWSSAALQPGYTVSNGLITQSTLTNVQPVVRNDIVKRNDSLFAAGWNLALGDGSGWDTQFDAGYSRVTRTDENLETYSGLGFRQTPFTAADTMTETLIPGQIPVIKSTVDYTDTSLFKLSDPQGWGPTYLPGGGMSGYLKYFQSKDELGQVKLLTKHELKSIFDNVEVGVSYTDRYKRDGEKPTGYIYPANGLGTAPLPPIIGTTDMSFLGIGRIYAYDPLAAYNSGVFGFYGNPNNDVIANRWNVTEKLSRAYVQFDVDTKIGSMPLGGNVGVQLVHVDQSSKGYSALGQPATLVHPVSGGDKYNDMAPSLNLTLTLVPRTYLRFSVARQLARPRMYDMRAARNYSYNSGLAGSTDPSISPWSADGGNPKLKPWRANSIDLSFEKYFKDNMGYISLAAFDKDLRNYIYQQSVIADFTGYPYTGAAPAINQGALTTPVNGQGGSLKGLEFTWSLPSELLTHKAVKGFGIVMGGAYTDSAIQPWGPGNGSSPIAGLSRKVANVTFYYEQHGFSARISERYRSSTREYITNFGPPNFKGDVTNTGFSTAQPEHVVDAQVSYTLQSGPCKGLTVYLQAYNLNNEPLITYNNDDPRQVMNYQVYGASYSFGASYKF